MSLKQEECIVTDEALDAVIKKFEDTTGIRDLEQAAEHIAANALYQIEVNHCGIGHFRRSSSWKICWSKVSTRHGLDFAKA